MILKTIHKNFIGLLRRLDRMSMFGRFAAILAAGYVLVIPLSLIPADIGFVTDSGPAEDFALASDPAQRLSIFVMAVIIAPLGETLAFGSLAWRFFHWRRLPFGRHRTALFLACSSLVFGALHYYSLWYILWAIVTGFSFGLLYYVQKRRNHFAFWTLAALHTTKNALAIAMVVLTMGQ